jgi:superoxide dismutase, Fe-Mn family
VKEKKFLIKEVKPTQLPFNPKKLRGLSEKLIKSHWENNYMASIKTLNNLNKKLGLAEKDFPPFVYDGLKREHLMRTGSIVHHDLYFGNLGGNGKAGGAIEKAIKEAFGSWDNWEKEFKLIGKSLNGGSGWVVLAFNFHLNRLENFWAPDHMHSALCNAPILIMDMFEHAYQIDFGAAGDKYIEAFFKNIDWEVVEERLEKVKGWKLV